MASIQKRPGSKIWYAQFYVRQPDGTLRQVRKSTGHTAKKLAADAAIDIERASKGSFTAGSAQAIKARAVLADAVAAVGRGELTADDYARHLSKLAEIANIEKQAAYTVGSWAAEWLKRKSGAAESTRSRYENHVTSLAEFVGKARAMAAVTPTDVRRWAESIAASGRASSTVSGFIIDARAMFTAAVRDGIIATNPLAAVNIEITRRAHDRAPFTAGEVKALLASAPCDEWRGLILIGASTGLRLGDAAKLRWENIDFDAGVITVIPSKTQKRGRVVVIPMGESLTSHLSALERDGDHVLPSLSRASIASGTGLSAGFVRIMSAAGVSRGKTSGDSKDGKSVGAGRVTHERGFHSLRHSLATRMRAAGVPEENRMAILGHTTRAVHSKYAHVSIDTLKSAIASIE